MTSGQAGEDTDASGPPSPTWKTPSLRPPHLQTVGREPLVDLALGCGPHAASVLEGGVLSENKVLLGKPTAPLEPPLQPGQDSPATQLQGLLRQVARVKLRGSL